MRYARPAAAAVCLSLLAMSAAAAPRFDSWTTVKNARHGFAIAFPTGVFEESEPPRTDEGRVFLSKDRRAKLLVGAFENAEESSLQDYRRYLIDEQYKGAAIDYAPVKGSWFVLSGTRGDEMFYQRVSFTCGGKLINSWAMLYPVAERKTYDRVVEAVAPTYSPGAGRTGNCD